MKRFIVLAFLTAAAPPVEGQEKPAADAKKEELEATLVAFKGTVDVKRPEDKDWVAAERNMKLKKGSEVCTAVASSATLLFTGNIKVDVKAITQARIEDLVKQGGAVNADVNLKFGTIKVDIQKGDLKTDMKVASPNSTTSVSGSTGTVRASAQRAYGRFVSLKTESGDWRQYVNRLGAELQIRGVGSVNTLGETTLTLDQKQTLEIMFGTVGRPAEEVNAAGGGDRVQGGSLIHDVYGSTSPLNPFFQQPAALPPPPPPPSSP